LKRLSRPAMRRDVAQGNPKLKPERGEVAELSKAQARLMLGADAPRPATDQL